MSPVEMAHAFDAPTFSKEGTNLTADELIKSVGGRRVQYGVLRSDDEMKTLVSGSGNINSGRLVFADSENSIVDRPYKGQVFDL